MQIEVAQLISELDRIADTTAFNGQVLLDGDFGTSRFQVGAEAGQTVSMTMTSAKTNALGSAEASGTGSYTLATDTSTHGTIGTAGALSGLSAAALNIEGTDIRASLAGDDTVSSSDNVGSSIAIAAAINASASVTGVRAEVEATTFDLGAVGTLDGTLAAAEITINGVATTTGGNVTADAAGAVVLAGVINNIQGSTGVVATVTGGGTDVTLTAADGRNIQIGSSGDAALVMGNFDFTALDDDVIRGSVTLYSNDAFTLVGSEVGFTAGVQALTETSWMAVATGFDNLAAGDLNINGFNVIAPALAGDTYGGSTLSDVDGADSAKAIAYAINNTEGLKEQVSATAKTVANLGAVTAYAGNDLGLTINGVVLDAAFTSAILDADSDGYMVGKLNASFQDAVAGAANYGLVASMNADNELVITSDAGVNIDVEVSANSTTSVLGNIDTTAGADVVHKGTVSLSGVGSYEVGTIAGAKQALAGIVSSGGDKIEDVDVSTFTGAQSAITAVDGALTAIDSQRATLGAIQNRFDSTIANLSVISENLSAAKARIMDADFALETANLTKAQILQQAGVAMLAQANQLPQSVLSLLQ